MPTPYKPNGRGTDRSARKLSGGARGIRPEAGGGTFLCLRCQRRPAGERLLCAPCHVYFTGWLPRFPLLSELLAEVDP